MTKGVGQSAAEKASQAAQTAKEKAQQGKEGSGSILQQVDYFIRKQSLFNNETESLFSFPLY